MNKKKGSAMVLAVLLLAFFMALSLNMWFISQKKAQRAGDKVLGNKVLTDIDGSSTLGYYEFYLATEYMNKGFVTSPSAFVIPSTTTTYASLDASGNPIFSTTNEGIQLSNEKQYFGSYFSSQGALTSSANAILTEVVYSNNRVERRDWYVTGGAIINELWQSPNWTTQASFGGYRIVTPVKLDGVNYNDYNNFWIEMNDLATKTAITIYEKNVQLNSVVTKNKPTTYTIRVQRTTVMKQTATNIKELDITSDDINEIVVTKQ